ncbi:MAG TPA: DoxX family protein [Aquabacterium sp.]|nr:DoxX family protein [Aquabacterium sp.]
MSFVSRALVALLFIPSGISKITGFSGTVAYITANNVPMPEAAAVIAILVELGLGVLLLVGYQTRWVALAMFFYVLVLPFIFHAYWSAPPARLTIERIMFYKDLAIAGGLLAFATWGAGAWSIDGARGRAGATGEMHAA